MSEQDRLMYHAFIPFAHLDFWSHETGFSCVWWSVLQLATSGFRVLNFPRSSMKISLVSMGSLVAYVAYRK